MAGRIQANMRSETPETDAGEVEERGSAGDGDGGDLLLGHELTGAVDALLALGEGDGHGLVAAIFKGCDGCGER